MLKFEEGVVVEQGLSTGGYFQVNGVGTFEGRNINVRITQISNHPDINGSVNKGGFVVLNNPNGLDPDTWVDFHIEMIDDNDQPIALPVTYWSVFDIEGPMPNKPESVRLRKDEVGENGENVTLHAEKPLTTINESDSDYIQYKAYGDYVPNPKDPHDLTEAQKEISAGFKMESQSEFYLGYQNVNAGRNCLLYSKTNEVLDPPTCDPCAPTCDCPEGEISVEGLPDGDGNRTCTCEPEEVEEFTEEGSGHCTDENSMTPGNFSANGYTKEACEKACINYHDDDCMGYSINASGRCALWIDSQDVEDVLPGLDGFKDLKGFDNPDWTEGNCLVQNKPVGNVTWMCYIRADHCEEEECCACEEPVEPERDLCENITEPCLCVDTCGWSSSDGTCKTGSSTDCYECKTGDNCVEGSCDSCEGSYDPLTTCQCTADCAEYENCCETCEPGPYEEKGTGYCTDENNNSPANFSANGYTKEACENACASYHDGDDCMGYSINASGRCALWIDSQDVEDVLPGLDGFKDFKGWDQPDWTEGNCLVQNKPVNNVTWVCNIRRDHCDANGCRDIIDPCACVESCGWDNGTCEPDGNTDCSECSTMLGCTTEEDECSDVAPSAHMKFEDGEVVEQNLSSGGAFQVNGVATYEGKNVNVRITQITDHPDINGSVNKGGFIVLNNPNKLEADEWVDFHVELIDDNGQPMALPVSYWSVFDLEGPMPNKPESVRLRKDEVGENGENVFLHETNPLTTINEDESDYIQYKAYTGFVDNPKDPHNLTEAQKEISAGFKLDSASEFYLGYQNVNAGRNCLLYSTTNEVIDPPICCQCTADCAGYQNCCETCESEEEFPEAGTGYCIDESGMTPANFSAGQYTKEACEDAYR
eukprot:UN23081